MVVEVARPVVHEVADARARRMDAAAAERHALGEELAVVDTSAASRRNVPRDHGRATTNETTSRGNSTKRPHRRRTRTVLFARWRQYAPHLHVIHAVGLTRVHIPNDISIGSAVFARLKAESPYTSQWAAAFFRQNYPFVWVSGPRAI